MKCVFELFQQIQSSAEKKKLLLQHSRKVQAQILDMLSLGERQSLLGELSLQEQTCITQHSALNLGNMEDTHLFRITECFNNVGQMVKLSLVSKGFHEAATTVTKRLLQTKAPHCTLVRNSIQYSLFRWTSTAEILNKYPTTSSSFNTVKQHLMPIYESIEKILHRYGNHEDSGQLERKVFNQQVAALVAFVFVTYDAEGKKHPIVDEVSFHSARLISEMARKDCQNPTTFAQQPFRHWMPSSTYSAAMLSMQKVRPRVFLNSTDLSSICLFAHLGVVEPLRALRQWNPSIDYNNPPAPTDPVCLLHISVTYYMALLRALLKPRTLLLQYPIAQQALKQVITCPCVSPYVLPAVRSALNLLSDFHIASNKLMDTCCSQSLRLSDQIFGEGTLLHEDIIALISQRHKDAISVLACSSLYNLLCSSANYRAMCKQMNARCNLFEVVRERFQPQLAAQFERQQFLSADLQQIMPVLHLLGLLALDSNEEQQCYVVTLLSRIARVYPKVSFMWGHPEVNTGSFSKKDQISVVRYWALNFSSLCPQAKQMLYDLVQLLFTEFKTKANSNPGSDIEMSYGLLATDTEFTSLVLSDLNDKLQLSKTWCCRTSRIQATHCLVAMLDFVCDQRKSDPAMRVIFEPLGNPDLMLLTANHHKVIRATFSCSIEACLNFFRVDTQHFVDVTNDFLYRFKVVIGVLRRILEIPEFSALFVQQGGIEVLQRLYKTVEIQDGIRSLCISILVKAVVSSSDNSLVERAFDSEMITFMLLAFDLPAGSLHGNLSFLYETASAWCCVLNYDHIQNYDFGECYGLRRLAQVCQSALCLYQSNMDSTELIVLTKTDSYKHDICTPAVESMNTLLLSQLFVATLGVARISPCEKDNDVLEQMTTLIADETKACETTMADFVQQTFNVCTNIRDSDEGLIYLSAISV